MDVPDRGKQQKLADPSDQRKRVEKLVWLVKKGDAASLRHLRIELKKSRRELAGALKISEKLLARWERGEAKPSKQQLITWRLALSRYIDDMICELLSIKNMEVVTQFWELMWKLAE